MATHVIRSPPSGFGSGSGSRGREQVYQSTNPCLSISSQTVLGIARLERYVPFTIATLYFQRFFRSALITSPHHNP